MKFPDVPAFPEVRWCSDALLRKQRHMKTNLDLLSTARIRSHVLGST